MKQTSSSFNVDELNESLLSKDKGNVQKLLEFICCVDEDSDEDIDFEQLRSSVRSQNRQSLKPDGIIKAKNELILLNKSQDKNYCLVRLTQKNFFVDYMNKKEQLKQKQVQKKFLINSTSITSEVSLANSNGSLNPNGQKNKGNIYFGLYERGIRISFSDIYNSLPEKVYRYFVERSCEIRLNLFLDPFCQHGASLIFFGMFGQFSVLYGLSPNTEHLENARHNSKLYNIKHKIELIKCQFTKCNFPLTLKSDLLLFIKPDYCFEENSGEIFSLERHIQPDINEILYQALNMSKNIILVLPKYTKIQEIPFYIGFHSKEAQLEINKIEIQIIQIDGVIQHYAVYIGQISNVDDQDELDFLVNQLLQDSHDIDKLRPTYELLQQIVYKIGFQKTMHSLMICKQKVQEYGQDTILQTWVNQLLQDQIVTKQQIKEKFKTDDLLLGVTPQYMNINQTPATFNPVEQGKVSNNQMTRTLQNYPPIENKNDNEISFMGNSFQSLQTHSLQH